MELSRLSWPEVGAYLERRKTVIIPVGSTEQHGPTGVIGTDWICADGIAKRVGERSGALVAPPICVGMAQHHLAFPGSISLAPATLIAVIRDTVLSLARHGFERFFFLNGHGGNIASLTAAFSELHFQRGVGAAVPPLRFALHNWWVGPGVQRLSRELFGDLEGSHATPSEISVAAALGYPARSGEITGPIGRSAGFHDAEDFRRRYPDGRIASDPRLAAAAHGDRLLAVAAEELAEALGRFEAEA